jgi:metal-responsive CopG/Arc/MetJ family transcriptional regulator
MKTSRRALVTLPEGVWDAIDNELKGKIGDGDSEVIRNIVLSYLMERGYLLKPREKSTSVDEIAGELDVHDSMITSLVEVLEKKGVLTQREWESKIKHKLVKNDKISKT